MSTECSLPVHRSRIVENIFDSNWQSAVRKKRLEKRSLRLQQPRQEMFVIFQCSVHIGRRWRTVESEDLVEIFQ